MQTAGSSAGDSSWLKAACMAAVIPCILHLSIPPPLPLSLNSHQTHLSCKTILSLSAVRLNMPAPACLPAMLCTACLHLHAHACNGARASLRWHFRTQVEPLQRFNSSSDAHAVQRTYHNDLLNSAIAPVLLLFMLLPLVVRSLPRSAEE